MDRFHVTAVVFFLCLECHPICMYSCSVSWISWCPSSVRREVFLHSDSFCCYFRFSLRGAVWPELSASETLFIPQTGAVFLFQESKDRVRKNYCIAQLCCDGRMRGGSGLDWSLLLPLPNVLQLNCVWTTVCTVMCNYLRHLLLFFHTEVQAVEDD